MPELIYEKKGHTAYITINRPEALNSLNYEVRKSLIDTWEEINKDPDVFSVIITGAGDRSFSSGADVKEVDRVRATDPGADLPLDMAETYGITVRKPMIAAINGYCMGTGFLIAVNSDFRIASENARFGVPEVKVAIVGMYGLCVRIYDYFPKTIADEMSLLGEPLSAQDAYRYGFLNKLVPQEKLMETAEEYATKLNSLSPLFIRMIKQTIRTANAPTPQAMAYNDCMNWLGRLTEDAKEGLLAFSEKRKPTWKGK